MSLRKKLWVDKHAPESLATYIFQNPDHQRVLTSIVEGKAELPHLLLTGDPGTGKTTISNLIIEALHVDPADVLIINASSNNGVDYARTVITAFSSTMPLGDIKIVQMEEFDRYSSQAQDLLRKIIEENSDTCRFICTANEEWKITNAMKSRLSHMKFKAPAKEDILVRMIEILDAEKITFDVEVLEQYVDASYPDIRKTIGNLQINSIGGTLHSAATVAGNSAVMEQLIELVLEGSFNKVRKLIMESTTVDDYEEIFRFLYKNIHRFDKIKSSMELEAQALVILNDAQYKHKLVAVAELNMDCCLINLQALVK